MKKISFILVLLLGICGFMPSAKADEVICANKEVVKGKIDYILSGFIGIETKDGLQKISREIQENNARDVVLVGLKNEEKITGHVYLLNEDYLEMNTASGKLRIPRRKIKEITIAEERL